MIRARLSPIRSGARYRSISLVAKISEGRAQGTLQVIPSVGQVQAYQLDLRLADRWEYRQALWNCLSPHVELSGQLPIPVSGSDTGVQHLPTPAIAPAEFVLDPCRSPDS